MRQKLLLFLLLLIGFKSLNASCLSTNIYLYPQSDKLDLDAYLILEAYANSQEIVPLLNKQYHARLKTKDHCVNLEIIEILKGDYRLTQVVFHAEQLLREGETYVLQIDSMPSYLGHFFKFNLNKDDYEGPVWKAEKLNKTQPKITTTPKETGQEYELLGCGPSTHKTFTLKHEGTPFTVFKTQVQSVDSNTTTTYYLGIDSIGEIKVGKGMCSGAFKFTNGTKYLIRFSPYGFNNKPQAYWTEWVSFKRPKYKKLKLLWK